MPTIFFKTTPSSCLGYSIFLFFVFWTSWTFTVSYNVVCFEPSVVSDTCQQRSTIVLFCFFTVSYNVVWFEQCVTKVAHVDTFICIMHACTVASLPVKVQLFFFFFLFSLHVQGIMSYEDFASFKFKHWFTVSTQGLVLCCFTMHFTNTLTIVDEKTSGYK